MSTKTEYIVKTVFTLLVLAAVSVAIIAFTYASQYFLIVYVTVLCQFLGLSCFLFDLKYLPHVITLSVSIPVFGMIVCLYARFVGSVRLKKLQRTAQTMNVDKNADNDAIAPLFCGKLCYKAIDEGAKVFFDGKDYFADMLCEIEGAKKSVYIIGYLFRNGFASDELLSSIKKAIEGGASVTIVADYFGGAPFFSSKKIKELISIGLKCVYFNKARLFITLADNFRLHSKLCVVDGEIAYLSSLNLGDDFLFEEGNYGVKAPGAAARFALFYAKRLAENGKKVRKPTLKPIRESFDSNGYIIPVFTSGESLYRTVIYLIDQAKDSVKIVSPYVSLDNEIKKCFSTLIGAGVLVQLIVPPKSGVKKPRAGEVEYSVNDLISMGVEVLETKSFLHSKMIVIDDKYLFIGSANFDLRSLTSAAEASLILTEKKKVVAAAEKFDRLAANCKRLRSEPSRKGFFYNVKRNVFRFFAPLV